MNLLFYQQNLDYQIRVENIKSLIHQTKERIKEKINREPSGYSFGSTFINNKLPAWECVKQVKNTLKNNRGAFYSEKHSNWIINDGAVGKEIVNLIKQTQKNVKNKLNIDLEAEVRII